MASVVESTDQVSTPTATTAAPISRRGIVLFLGAMLVFQVALFNARLANHDTLEELAATVHPVHTATSG